MLSVAADATTPKGRTESLSLRIGYGRTGALEATIDVRVIASTRPTIRLVDRTVDDGVEGQQSTVDVLEGAFNPFPGSPLTVVGRHRRDARRGHGDGVRRPRSGSAPPRASSGRW